ncbi:unnamed protein product [Ectocarpus fasciculatus]
MLMPMSGPAIATVHKIIAASIMQAFDLEHPDSGILDTGEVAVRFKRHVYVKESSFQAGELRQLNISSELSRLAASLWQNESVTSGVLELTPCTLEPSTSRVETAAMARKLLGSSVAKPNKTGNGVGPRIATCDDGTSWVLPAFVYFSCDRKYRSGEHQALMLRVRLKKGTCQVNGRTIFGQGVFIQHLGEHINKQTILALRALNAELFPVNGPAQDRVHTSVAARILRAFDKQNPSSDILDETVVNIRIQRHNFVTESSFVAGELRVENKKDLAILTQRFLNDPAVMSGELPPATAPVTCTMYAPPPHSGSTTARHETEKSKDTDEEVSTAFRATATDELLDATLVGKEREREQGEVWPVTNVDDTSSLSLPWGIYPDAKDANGDETMRLKVKLGACWVNGESVAHAKKMKVVGGVAVNASNIAALRSLRDDFGLGLGASKRVKMIIAAKLFRLWLRTRRGSHVSDSAPVSITDAAGTGLRPTVIMTAGELRGVDIERSRVVKKLLHALGATGTDAERVSFDHPIPGTPMSTKGKKRKRTGADEVTHSSDPVPSTANDRRKRERDVEGGSGNKTAGNCASLGRPGASDGSTEWASSFSAEVLKQGHRHSGGRMTLGCSALDGVSSMTKPVVIDLTSGPAASQIEESDRSDAAGPGSSDALSRGAKGKKRRRRSSTPAQEYESEARVARQPRRGDLSPAAASSARRRDDKKRSGKDQRMNPSESVQSGGVGNRAERERKAEQGTDNASGKGVAGGSGGVQDSCTLRESSAVIVSASCSSSTPTRDKSKKKKGTNSDQPAVSKAVETLVWKTAGETAGCRRSSGGQRGDGPDNATLKAKWSVEGESRGAKAPRFGKKLPPSKDRKKKLMRWIAHG